MKKVILAVALLAIAGLASAVDVGVYGLYEKGTNGEVYNIGSDNEWSNGELVKKILSIMDKWEVKLEYVDDRLGHDRRYAIDSSKAHNELGWKPLINFEDGLQSTIHWYISN